MVTPDTPITAEDVKVARRAWRTAVEARDVTGVVALYHREGRLLGTMDDGTTARRQSPERIRDYFESFLAREGIRATFLHTVTSEDVVPLGPGYAAYSGYYDFTFLEDGATRTAKATFTFVYRRGEDGQLRILVHNSGFTPEGLH